MSQESHGRPSENDPDLPPSDEVGGRGRHGRFPVERAIGAMAIFIIVAISAANVVVRYATDASFAFTEEYSVFLLVVLTFAGTAAAARDDGHIRILAFAKLFGPPIRRAMLVASTLATVTMFMLVIWYGVRLALDEHRYGDVSAGLGNPAWLYTIAMPILCVPVILRVVIAAVGKWRRGEP